MRFFSLLLLPCVVWAQGIPTDSVDTLAADGVAPTSVETHSDDITKTVEMHLSPDLSSPVVMTAAEPSLSDATQEQRDADGNQWYSTSRNVTLEGYVDNDSITKDLDILEGAKIWSDMDHTSVLAKVDDPSQVRLLDAQRHMGHVEFSGEQKLYFADSQLDEPVYSVDLSQEEQPNTMINDQTIASDQIIDEPAGSPAMQISSVSAGALRSVEGWLRKGMLFGNWYLQDDYGHTICAISKKSPIRRQSLVRYRNMKVVLVGEMDERGSALLLRVRSVRLR